MVKAVILAGGKGERLGSLTRRIPKPMLKIGNLPLLEHQINLLKKYGIKEIAMITGYLSEVIESYFKDGKNFGVRISYFKEENPLGTAGGLKEIKNKLKNDFLLLYGDVMANLDINGLIKFHKKKGGIASLALHPNDHPQDSDLAEINQDKRIASFHAKPHPENKYFQNLVNAGLYALSPKIIKYIKRGAKADFGKDVFPKLVSEDKIYGYVTAEYLKDMGTPLRLAEVRRDYKSGKIFRLNRENKRRAIFLDRDGTINDALRDVCRLKDFKLLPESAEAIKKINGSEFLAIVITNQPAIAKGLCAIDDIEKIHKKMGWLLGKAGAKLDAIYYCPHHPDRGFTGENLSYKIKCDCRKPEIGMIIRAKNDFNINLKESYFVGDSWRDILCGKKAGITTLGVKTGKGCRDGNAKPDYFFKNLNQAVNFIIKKIK